MAKDYSADPTDVKNFTQSSEVNLTQDIQDYSEFLPAVNRTESLERFFGSTVNQLLSSGSTQSIDAYWGRLAGRNYNPANEQFNLETDATRLNYQFQPGTVSRIEGETQQTVSYVNWLKRLESLGSDLDNHDRLFSEPGYTLDMPTNADMFINYANYYWLEGNMPLVTIEATVTDPIDIDDIVVLSQYTTPTLGNYKSVEFVTGLRVQFTGIYSTSTSGDYAADAIYYVENVGGRGCIKLVEIVDASGNDVFPEITPYHIASREGFDTVDFDATPWDGLGPFDEYDITTTTERQDLVLNKSYIVMERWAQDKNPWARTNKWFSIYALRIAVEYNGLELEAYLNVRTRADRPIIEFHANMELYDTCKTFVETVDYAISLDQVTEMLSGREEFFIDSENAVQNGDIVLVAKEEAGGITLVEYNGDFGGDFDAGDVESGPYATSYSSAFSIGVQASYYEDSFTVSGVGSSITLTPYNTYVADEYVIISQGTEKGFIYCLKDGSWDVAQNKELRGTPPLFNLYNQYQVALEDFDNNNFLGDRVFGYAENTTGAFDRELGFAVAFTDQGTFANYKFDWTLSNTRYNQDVTVSTSEEIPGYYFWRNWVEDEHYNGWSNIRGGQRVPVIQTEVADGTNDIVFELGTASVGQSLEYTVTLEDDFYHWYDHSYIDRTNIGYNNADFIWKYDTEYTINDLISVTADKLEFTDPYGNADVEIVDTTISSILVTLTVNAAYAYDKVLYRMQSDPTVTGEIHLSNTNQNRYSVVLNGRRLIDGIDFVFSGTEITVTATTEEFDVIELVYIADVDLANVVYDVAPVHYFNSDNNPFIGAGYDDLINHLSRQLSAMPGFDGEIAGDNNYHNTLRQHTYDGLIRQQIFRTKNVQYLLDQENINPIRALKSFSKDYVDFKRFFENKIRQLWTTETWDSVRDLVDRALSDINIGKNEDFKYANSDMAYFKQAVSEVYSVTDTTTTFALPQLVNQYGDTQNHVQVYLKEYDGVSRYIENPLTKDIDYTIEGPNVELTSAVTLNGGSDPATVTIRWYDYAQLSGIPFSTTKLGFFKPTQVEVVNGKLIGHDGSEYTLTGADIVDTNSGDFDVVGAAFWDYELRVFNNLVDAHFVGFELGHDMIDCYPNPVSEFAYDVDDLNVRLDDWYNRYAIRNEIDEIDDVDYDGGDEFTWNYTSVGTGLGSWRSLYVYNFGTDRPETHPWEMLGHSIKPTWWDVTYSWTAGVLRGSLEIALTYGITGNATTPYYVDIRYARPNFDWLNDNLVSDDGLITLIGPVTSGLVSTPASVDAAKDFVFGDWSEIENGWRKSSEYKFALAEVYLQLKPYRTHEIFWMLNRWEINRATTQVQWIDPDTCQRLHISEIHNQQITDGIISKINVVEPGTGYTYLDLEFKQDTTCWRDPSAEAYTNTGAVVGVAVTDPGRGFNNAPEVNLAGPIGADGVELEYIIDLDYTVTRLGFNTLPAEEYRANTTVTDTLSDILAGLDIVYMVQTGGFTDKRILSVELDGDYESGNIHVPDSSYNILIDRNAPIKTVFYSGVKIEKVEGAGYRVEGYNLDSKFFNYLVPSTSGNQIPVAIGNTEVIKHMNWRNEVHSVPYRTSFIRRQDLYQFLVGLGQYYETVGFDAIVRWEVEARSAIEWAIDSNQTDAFYVNGIDETLTYNQGSHGVVQTVDVNYDGVPNVLDETFKTIRRNELLVLRNDDSTEFSLKTGDDRLLGLGVRVVEFEHIITIDNISTFNDPIYQPELGLGQNRIKLVGERTRNWNGRAEAPGYLIQDTGLILNIESSVRELEQDWVTSDSKALERLTRQTIGFNVGYSKPTYMTNTFIGDDVAYKFEKGERKYKGTAQAIEAMARNKNIFGIEFDHELYEEWMVRLGDYGDTSEREPLQFGIEPNKVKSDPQHFRFNEEFVSDSNADLIIDLHKGSPDAVSGNYDRPFEIYNVLRLDNTSINDLDQYQEFTRDAGLPLVDEIDYFLGTIDNIGEVYDPTQEYALIPNWTETTAYVQGDRIRRFGKVYRLLIDTTGLTTIADEIVIRGTQVFPLVANGLTFIANDETVTFAKNNTTTTYDTIVVDGIVANPTVPSGDTLVLDGINVNFIKTETTTTYSDIVLDGNVTNPNIVNSASRAVTIGYANTNAPTPLTNVTVDFNELSPTLTMQQIWVSSLSIAGVADPLTEATGRISQLETLRGLYVTANSIAAWETFVDNYYDAATNPDYYVNPEYLGIQVAANPGAAWEVAARALIVLDLALLTELGGTHTETEATMVLGRGSFNNATTFDADMDTTNNLLDFSNTANDVNENLQDYRAFVETNGGATISDGTAVTVTNPTEYVTDDVIAIANKIAAALLAGLAPVDITVSPGANIITITRANNLVEYRLGVTTDADLGFLDSDNDVETSGSTVTGPVDLTLSEAVIAVNNASITGVSAGAFNSRMRLTSINESLAIGNGTANNDLGFSVSTVNAVPTTVVVPVDLSIGDVVTQINVGGIEFLTASQVEGALILTYTGTTLIIGDGTANVDLGITAATYETTTDAVENIFIESEWEVVQDPAHFNIWTIDNIGSNPIEPQTTTNRYDVYQTIDFQIGIIEVCAGAETGDNALIHCDDAHTLNIGDYVLIINSTCVPSADGIHQVTHLQDEFGFFIDRYVDEKGFTGKVLPVRSVRFPNSVTANNAMTDSDYVQGTLGLRSADYVYVDSVLDGNSEALGYGAVYEVERTVDLPGLILVRNENGKTNNSNIESGLLYSAATNETVIRFEVFDPLKGIIPGIADAEIDLRSDVDYAYYNNSTNPDMELRNQTAWGQQQVGNVWWDLGTSVYLNYDQSTPEYRQEHWGKLFPTSTIDVYEWTKSPVTPDEYIGAVEAGTIIDGTELTGTPYAIVDQFGEEQFNWSEEIELNPNTNQIETYFYYWVQNKTTTPTLERLYSITQLAEIILEPTSQEVNWLAATGEETLLVSSLSNAIGYDDLIMKVNFNVNPSDYHQEFALLAEDDPALLIPEWLHISLRDSLAGFTQNKGLYDYTSWNGGTTYSPDRVVISGTNMYYRCHTESLNNNPDSDSDNDYWTLLEVYENNPDGDYTGVDLVAVNESQQIPTPGLHKAVRYGIETRPHQTWFIDVAKARRVAIDKINDQLGAINLVDSDILWREAFERTFNIGDLVYDITDYWNFVSWSRDGVIFERGVGDYFVETVADLAALTPVVGDIAQVETTINPDGRSRRAVYAYEDSAWALVYKEKATIFFNTLLWENEAADTGWDIIGWDTDEWDKSSSAVMVEIFDSFFNDIWIEERQAFYGDLWFHMTKHVLHEQPEVDWIFKSSYFKLITEDTLEKQYNKYFTENIDDFIDYVNTVKPFRSKLRDAIIRKLADDEAELTSLDAIEIRVQTNPVDETIDETDTRAFRLHVGSGADNYSSQIVNEHKVLLGIDIGPDDLIIPYLNTGTGTLPTTPGVIWINGERIEYTSQTTVADAGIGSGFTTGFSTGFGGVTLLSGITRGTQGTFARRHSFADVIEDATGLGLTENADLSDYGLTTTGLTGDLGPAWNELGDGLLDAGNLDPNGITINAEAFGTIDLYGNILYAQWLALQEPADAIENFANELEELIEVYWLKNYPWLTGDTDLITADTIVYTADGGSS